MTESKKNRITLAEANPELAAQWHPTKNGNLTPNMVMRGARKKVWWLRPYDDPKTGKHFDFEWEAKISDRSRGIGCPFLSGKAAWPGYNDLATKRPDLAKEWHPTRNEELTPEMVTCGSNKEVWWLLPYDDTETGKHFDFEWESLIVSRAEGAGCPYMTGNAVWSGYNDLATKFPELAKEWHPTKNGPLTPDKVISGSVKKVWWLLPYDDPVTGKHFDFDWPAGIANRTKGEGCPFLVGKAVYSGYNDLASKRPDLAKEWHPTKNGDLTPDKVTCGAQTKVWWMLPYDDPKTGKHFDFEWEATIANRSSGYGCPYLAGTSVWPGFNDLATKRPDLAALWHPTKNGDVTPADVTVSCDEKVWWFLPYDDPETGKHFDFEWEMRISGHSRGYGCPFLSGRAVWVGYNDLASKCPELAAQWHPELNRRKTPELTYQYARRKVWWLCPVCGHEWRSAVYKRVCVDELCPECKKRMPRYI